MHSHMLHLICSRLSVPVSLLISLGVLAPSCFLLDLWEPFSMKLWGLIHFGTSYPRAQIVLKRIVVCLNTLPLTDGDDSPGWGPQVDFKSMQRSGATPTVLVIELSRRDKTQCLGRLKITSFSCFTLSESACYAWTESARESIFIQVFSLDVHHTMKHWRGR